MSDEEKLKPFYDAPEDIRAIILKVIELENLKEKIVVIFFVRSLF